MSHEAEGFAERGLSGTLTFDPRPESDRGLSLDVAQSVGTADAGGTHALFERETMAGLGTEAEGIGGRRLEATLGYGFGMFGNRSTAIPEVGLVHTDTQWERRFGWRLAEVGQTGFVCGLDVESAWSGYADGSGGEHRLDIGFGWRLEEKIPGGANVELRFEAARTESTDAQPDNSLGA